MSLRRVVPRPVRDAAGLMWVAFTPKGYENMALNLQDMLTHIEQKNDIIRYYETCILAERARAAQ